MEWCGLRAILDIYVGITLDKVRQDLMVVVPTSHMKCTPSILILPIWIDPLSQQMDHIRCMAIISSPPQLLIQGKVAIVVMTT